MHAPSPYFVLGLVFKPIVDPKPCCLQKWLQLRFRVWSDTKLLRYQHIFLKNNLYKPFTDLLAFATRMRHD